MSTEIYSDKALGSDGPTYHHARAALNYVHKNEDSNATYYTSVALYPMIMYSRSYSIYH